jgi:hypothetical protein
MDTQQKTQPQWDDEASRAATQWLLEHDYRYVNHSMGDVLREHDGAVFMAGYYTAMGNEEDPPKQSWLSVIGWSIVLTPVANLILWLGYKATQALTG